MRASTATWRRGFTLVELMIVVAIIGVLAALAVVGVRRYLAATKTAEAKQTVGAIARAAATQYERERDISELLTGGISAATTHLLCDTAIPVPNTLNLVRGTKYQPSTAVGSDFLTGSPVAGWRCLGFAITSPISFQYYYTVAGPYFTQGIAGAPAPSGPESFEAAAQGDLDNDNVPSTFARTGQVVNGQLVMSTQIFVDNELE